MRRDRLTEAVGLAAASLAVLTLFPLSATRGLPDLEYGLLVALAGLGGAALAVAASAAVGLTRGALAERLRAVALWAACATAVALALAAVALTAQTLSLRRLVEAQVNTLPYLFLQPVAAAASLAGAVLAGEERALTAVLGPDGRMRRAAEAAVVALLAALGATAFLAGYAGPALPGALWVLLKAGLIAATLLALRARLRAWDADRRLRAAWALLVPVALLNVAVTVAVLAR